MNPADQQPAAKSRWAEALNLLLVAAGFAIAAALYSRLPDPVPTHFDLTGHPNGFIVKPWGVFVLPLSSLGVYALLSLAPALSPRGFEIEPFARAYATVKLTVLALLLGLTWMALRAALQPAGDAPALQRWLGLAISISTIALGNVMGKLRKNFYVGIRTPWTLSSDEVWLRTHRLGGKLFVAAGLIGVAAAALGANIVWVVIPGAIAASVSIVYSKRLASKLEPPRRSPEQ